MSEISEGQLVRFKGDPDQEEYLVNYINFGGDSADLEPRHGGHEWEYIPLRLLERVPDPVKAGEVYRGKITGDLYFVVPNEGREGVSVVHEGRVTDADPGVLRDHDAFQRIREAL